MCNLIKILFYCTVGCGEIRLNADVLFDASLLFNENDPVCLSIAEENILALE
jgi:hypothetical protein